MRNYIGVMSVAAALFLLVYFSVRGWMIARKKIQKNIPREVLLGIFVVSMAALAGLALQPSPGYSLHPAAMAQVARERLATGTGINLVPFEMAGMFYDFHWKAFCLNILGNIIMFIPLGLCLPLLYEFWENGWRVFLLSLAVPAGIEVFQLFIGRSTDIDDLILNVAGVMAGFGLFKAAKKIFSDWEKVQKKHRCDK